MGAIPDFNACRSFCNLYLGNNPDLSGTITRELVARVWQISYHGCKPYWGPSGKNEQFMTGPFIVGASMASENIQALLVGRKSYNISPTMLKDAPVKGDFRYPMTRTHGENWVAWQDVWLN